ncbi:hypothetical protein IscW_ISCW015300 [Ixodes scapularis]|uniref:Uncharacterized protein n=1 Tax=Ixodes scapularis TaxID=6945 RepID=B7QMM7_IXOSC|nr:hypothetical protein IscW_ISCW015300 [Ixodes scapularis]|eukprot:XP_002399935.1 hypothetical protein IscW_ISCW015300 [Ixodes scapularis]
MSSFLCFTCTKMTMLRRVCREGSPFLFLFLHPLSVAAPVPCACRPCCRSAFSLTVLRGEGDLEVTRRKASVQCRNPSPYFFFFFICFAAVGFFRLVYLKIKCYPCKIRRVSIFFFFFIVLYYCYIYFVDTLQARESVFVPLCSILRSLPVLAT